MPRNGLFRGALFCFAAIVVLGCQTEMPDRVTPDGTIVQSRLNAVHWLYTTFREKRQRPPANAAELQKFGLELPTHEGGPVSLTEEFLVSPRDQKPIVVHYGLKSNDSSSGGERLLAHEQDGFNGRRYVIYAESGMVEEVDDARFRELQP